jgi:hypothetical protein
MPDFASRRLATTSCVELPIEETMPIPVMTTRFMSAFLALSVGHIRVGTNNQVAPVVGVGGGASRDQLIAG